MGEIFIGIDLGSTSAKAAVLNGKVLASAIKPTGSNLRKTGEMVLEELLANRILESEVRMVF